MKFGTHVIEIIKNLYAKFQLPKTTLSLEFQTGSEASPPQREVD